MGKLNKCQQVAVYNQMEMQLETMEAECAHLKGLLEEVVKLKGRGPEPTFEETKLSPPNEQ